MVIRPFWQKLLSETLKKRPVLWLAGVRRSGKTTLCHQLDKSVYFDCELPSVRRDVEEEGFWGNFKNKIVVLDEVHRLSNPAQILKIAADHHPTLKVIATGSSTLAATAKFSDTLTGRKAKLWLTPMNYSDQLAFDVPDFKKRLYQGGLPSFLNAEKFDEQDYQEWLDSFWSRDIQELFRLGNRSSFLKFFELIMAQSGGIFESQSFAGPCEVSRPTIMNYLSVLETTLTAYVIRPFSKRLSSEIISAPKVYGFDTGFVSFTKGWSSLDNEQAGLLFEHWVLNEFNSVLQQNALNYWRDKAGHEIDFVWKRRGKDPIAIECKWNDEQFDAGNLLSFRHRHPKGENILVAANRKGRKTFETKGLKVTCIGMDVLADWIRSSSN